MARLRNKKKSCISLIKLFYKRRDLVLNIAILNPHKKALTLYINKVRALFYLFFLHFSLDFSKGWAKTSSIVYYDTFSVANLQ